ncbi:hypothetical protein F5Y19DRAFT_480785 [Xylariaceae sp. FL1651]|nr:hypothetical protein F5Y19DRAFT_480785 [Xylariaceae sp. FL1651]
MHQQVPQLYNNIDYNYNYNSNNSNSNTSPHYLKTSNFASSTEKTALNMNQTFISRSSHLQPQISSRPATISGPGTKAPSQNPVIRPDYTGYRVKSETASLANLKAAAQDAGLSGGVGNGSSRARASNSFTVNDRRGYGLGNILDARRGFAGKPSVLKTRSEGNINLPAPKLPTSTRQPAVYSQNYPLTPAAIVELADYLDRLEAARRFFTIKYEHLSCNIASESRRHAVEKLRGNDNVSLLGEQGRLERLIRTREEYRLARTAMDDPISQASVLFYTLFYEITQMK